MRKKYITTLLISIISAPGILFAAPTAFSDLVNKFIDIINTIVPILISLAMVLFFFHTGKGIFGHAKDSGQAQAQLKETLFWGIVIIFVMVSIWGILTLIGSEFNLIKNNFTR